jgi:phosphoserine phosphatase
MKSEKIRKAFFSAAAFFLALPSAAKPASKRPLNWRYHKKMLVSTETVTGVGVSTAPAAPEREPVRLMAGRWNPGARAAIEVLIQERGRGAAAYDAKVPPIAVLPWSDAAVAGDPAELVFLSLVTEAKFRVDDAWWELVPIAYGRQPVRAAYEEMTTLSSATWTSQPSYHAWRKGMLSSYLNQCRGLGRKECRSYLARLWAGWRDDDAQDYAKQVLKDEMRRVTPVEMIPGEPDDRKPLRARRGLRVIPEMRDLVAKLRGAGFDVWVIDDVPQPVLAASAGDYGVDPSRIYGVQNSTQGARMGGEIMSPVPTRGGKTAVMQTLLGRPADLAVGRDAADIDVLSYGDGLRVVFDSDAELVKKARERGWLIQHAFAR